jgi:hypothetical protein
VLNPIENAITAIANMAGSIFGIALFLVGVLISTCVETIHHVKHKASKMGASAKLEAPIPHGKNTCANLNGKTGTKKLRIVPFAGQCEKIIISVKPRPEIALFRQYQ